MPNSSILVVFDERVWGSIRLLDEARADIRWVSAVGLDRAVLFPRVGQELEHETTYFIHIEVEDESGNRFETTILFVTAPKE